MKLVGHLKIDIFINKSAFNDCFIHKTGFIQLGRSKLDIHINYFSYPKMHLKVYKSAKLD